MEYSAGDRRPDQVSQLVIPSLMHFHYFFTLSTLLSLISYPNGKHVFSPFSPPLPLMHLSPSSKTTSPNTHLPQTWKMPATVPNLFTSHRQPSAYPAAKGCDPPVTFFQAPRHFHEKNAGLDETHKTRAVSGKHPSPSPPSPTKSAS